MTEKNPTQNRESLEAKYDFKVSDEEVGRCIVGIKQIEAANASKISNKIREINVESLKTLLAKLEEAKAERSAKLAGLKAGEAGNDSDIEEIDFVVSEINETLNEFKTEKKEIKQENIPEFTTPDDVLAVYPESIEKASAAKNTLYMSVLTGKLEEAEAERKGILNRMETEPETVFIDSEGERVDKASIKNSLTNIKKLLKFALGEAETMDQLKNTEGDEENAMQPEKAEVNETKIPPQLIKEVLAATQGFRSAVKRYMERVGKEAVSKGLGDEISEFVKSKREVFEALEARRKKFNAPEDSYGMEIYLNQLQSLEQLISPAKTEEETIPEPKQAVEEPVAEKNKEVAGKKKSLETSQPKTKIEKLDPKYNFIVGEVEIDKLLKDLAEIESIETEGALSESKKKELNTKFAAILDRLDEAAAEREETLKILKAKPETIYQNSFGVGLYISKIEAVIEKIDAATEGLYEDSVQETEAPTVEKPKADETKITKESTTIAIEPESVAETTPVPEEEPKNENILTEEEKAEEGQPTQEQIDSLTPGAARLNKLHRKLGGKNNIKFGDEDFSQKQKPESKEKKAGEKVEPKTETEPGEFKPYKLEENLTSEQIEVLKKDTTLYRNLTDAIEDYNKSLKKLGGKTRKQNYLDEVELFKNMFLKQQEGKGESKQKTPKKEKTKENNSKPAAFKRISLGDPADPFYVSPENKSIMENSGFIIPIAKAVNEYNDLLARSAANAEATDNLLIEPVTPEAIKAALEKITSLREEFNRRTGKYIRPDPVEDKDEDADDGRKLAVNSVGMKYFEAADYGNYADKNAKKKHPKYKKPSAVNTYYDSDFEEEGDIEKYIAKNQTPEKGKKKEKAAATAGTPVPEPKEAAPQGNPSSEAPADQSESRLYTMEEGVDYSDLAEDVQFNKWLENIAGAIERKGIPLKTQVQDLEDWYDEYEECLPYENKLRAMQEDIKKTAGKNPVTVMMTEKKIGDLLFGIHMEGDSAREKIDSLYEKFETVQKQAAKIENLKKTKEIKLQVEKQINENGGKTKIKGLAVEQVKAILETGGEVNARETIEEMVEFLEDISYNYDFYNKTTEDTHDNMYRLYKKHAASKDLHGEKIRWYQKLTPKFLSRMPTNIDQNDFNNFESVIYKIRELDLVDRKVGGTDKAMANKSKMTKLIRFCKGQEFLLAKHMTDPDSNKEAEFADDEEKKEMLKTFDKLMKTFADSKYRGKEALERANEMLKAPGTSTNENTEDLTQTTEIFFDDAAEEAVLRKEATKDVFRDALKKLDAEINASLTKNIKAEDLSSMSARFESFKFMLETVGDGDSDKLNIQKTRLRLDDLVLKNLKKDVYKELSAAFPVYDRIIQSPDRKPEEKKVYINELLAALQEHITNKGNTPVQEAILSDTIKKYTKILSDIK